MNRRPTGVEGHPYPNVQAYIRDDESRYYAATFPHDRRCGRRMSRYLGIFNTAERAYLEVLDKRIEDMEYRTNQWRRERDELLGVLVRKKRGRPRKDMIA